MTCAVDFFTGTDAAGRVSLWLDFAEPTMGEREIFDFDAVFVSANEAWPGDVSPLFFGFICDVWIEGIRPDAGPSPAGRGADPALGRAV